METGVTNEQREITICMMSIALASPSDVTYTNRYTAFVENQKTEMKKWQIDGEFQK